MLPSLKKKPSQVAQVDTPRPISSRSSASPSSRAEAPVAMITLSASYTPLSARMTNGRLPKSTLVTSSAIMSVPKRSPCLRIVSMRSGPRMPSTKPGKFSTCVVSISWPPAWTPVNMSGARLARAA